MIQNNFSIIRNSQQFINIRVNYYYISQDNVIFKGGRAARYLWLRLRLWRLYVIMSIGNSLSHSLVPSRNYI